MEIPFTKMESLGNDFVLLDMLEFTYELDPPQIRRLSDRHLGVGCDQVLIIAPPSNMQVDYDFRIFNADGSEVGQCGNGARCAMAYLRDAGLLDRDRRQIKLRTRTTSIELELGLDGSITADLGEPRFEPDRIPFLCSEESDTYTIDTPGGPVTLAVVNIGNPHAVVVEPIDDTRLRLLGPLIEMHSRFPERTNVSFPLIHSPAEIDLRVYERFIGETLACGSGACATVAVGQKLGLLDDVVQVNLPGGQLIVRCATATNGHLYLTGPARTVFVGSIRLQE